MIRLRQFGCVCLTLALACVAAAQSDVSTRQLSSEVNTFLGRELKAHVADIHSLHPPPQRVLGALTTGDFSWGAFMRALASYSALSGQRTIARRNVPRLVGEIGLIESRNGGKTFAQLAGAIAVLQFGADLKTNPVWQALTPAERDAWRLLLDPARFYDRKTRRVIDLPENYYGVAARVAAMDYRLGLVSDRAFADDLIDRAAEQFTKGNLYADDGLPTGRFDRYSNEYARFVYLAAEDAGRTDVMKALAPTLSAQMRLWWDLVSPDGYGYPWGRTLGPTSYMDTLEIVGFLARHAQFRPAPLPQLTSVYYAAWQWLTADMQRDRHLLNIFGFGRGNYRYISKEREWQQTITFLAKAAAAQSELMKALRRENVASFPAQPALPGSARFEFFRKGDRPAGVWLVRQPGIRFALPIVAGPRPGIADYLPAPFNLTAFGTPVEQTIPAATPYLELEDGRVLVAGDGADVIEPSTDGLSLRAVWKRWAVLGAKAGDLVDPGLTTEVTWTLNGDSLIRREVIEAAQPVKVRRFWVVIPSTGTDCVTRYAEGKRSDRLNSPAGALEVSAPQSDWPLTITLQANGDTAAGKGDRGPVPLQLSMEARNVTVVPGTPVRWTLVLKSFPKKSCSNQAEVCVADGAYLGQR